MGEPTRSERVIVCGGRGYHDGRAVFDALDRQHAATPFELVISGGASGADSFGIAWAMDRGVDYVIEPADWLNEGRAAGPKRNQRMIDKHAPTRCIAFAGGRGTDDMLRRAQQARLTIGRYD